MSSPEFTRKNLIECVSFIIVKKMKEYNNRIISNPKILSGKPVFKGTRIPISIVLTMLRDGASFQKIIEEYPKLTEEDIKAVLDYSVFIIDHPEEEIINI